ncbi:MAG: MFS transporter [Clostridiaceae bacterium]|nr:MFS transporter [Clostridiaceae bacterium]
METFNINQIDGGKTPDNSLSKYRRRVIALGFIGTAGCGLAYVAFQAQSSEIMSVAGLDSSYSGAMISMFYAGYILVLSFASQFGERLGQIRLLLLGCTFNCLGVLCIAFATSPVLLISGLILAGMSQGLALSGFGNVVMAAVPPEDQVRYSSFTQAFFSLSAFLAPLLIVRLLAGGIALKWFFVSVFVYYVALIVAILFVIPRHNDPFRLWGRQIIVTKDSKKTSASSLQFLVCLRKFEFFLLSLAIMFYVAFEVIVAFYVGPYISDLGGSRELASLALSLFWVGLLAGRLIFSMFNVKLNQLTLAAAPVATFIIAALMLLVPNPVFVCVMTALVGLFSGPLWPMFLSLGRGLFLDMPTAAMSMMALTSGFTGVTFPPLLSLPNNPAQTLILNLIPTLLLALICLYLYFGRRQVVFHNAKANDSTRKIS